MLENREAGWSLSKFQVFTKPVFSMRLNTAMYKADGVCTLLVPSDTKRSQPLKWARLISGSHSSHFVVRLKLFLSKPFKPRFPCVENDFFLNSFHFLGLI